MSDRYNPIGQPYNERFTADYDELSEYVDELHEVCRKVVRLRSQGMQRRGEMHEAISELGKLIGVGPCPTE